MSPERLRALLERVASGTLTPEAGLEELKHLPFEDLGFARLDHHRALRVGFPEVIFGQGKTLDQIRALGERLAASGHNVLVTRLDPAMAPALINALPGAVHDPVARTLTLTIDAPRVATRGTVLVVAAGTTDLPVAQEAVRTLEAFGNPVGALSDVGVSGLHRLLDAKHALVGASVIIVVAGMEGALPSVVAGLVDCPVIAVPTSVGYGASFGGLAALLAMLNSCAAGVTVVNIDNGFGAAVAASLINRA
ncbi:MAG TPA: nickel pincer cofactor biosynthesis protein LarB [Candidatus Binatia bacterium]|nr:nickel pincer cofactor biosynthesis protein LarB [Candidatus Binatia bacterium]